MLGMDTTKRETHYEMMELINPCCAEGVVQSKPERHGVPRTDFGMPQKLPREDIMVY